MAIKQYTIKRIVEKSGTYGPYLALEVGDGYWLMVYDPNLHDQIRELAGAMVNLDVVDKQSVGAKGSFTRHDVRAIVTGQSYSEANAPAQMKEGYNPPPNEPRPAPPSAPPAPGAVGSPEFTAVNRETRITALMAAATFYGADAKTPRDELWKLVAACETYLISGKMPA